MSLALSGQYVFAFIHRGSDLAGRHAKALMKIAGESRHRLIATIVCDAIDRIGGLQQLHQCGGQSQVLQYFAEAGVFALELRRSVLSVVASWPQT